MEVDKLTRIGLAWELFSRGVPKSHIARELGIHRETVHLWMLGIASHPGGLVGFLEDYRNAKKGERAKRKIDGWLKNKIWSLRDSQRECCGQKIRKFLIDDYSISLSTTTIYKILAEKYKLRSKWKKNQPRGHIPRASRPREVVQLDTIDFGEVYAFTSIDIFTQEVEAKLYPSLTALDGLNFLVYSFYRRYKHTDVLQTDGGAEFKREFRQNVFKFADRFRNARPYRKNEQSYIESFNRSLRKECLGWSKYRSKDIPELDQELQKYLLWYHNKRPHMGLSMQTPNEFLKKYLVSDI